MKYRMKIEVEAVKYTGDNKIAIHLFTNGKIRMNTGYSHLTIPTYEGGMTVFVGDWVVKGISGEFHPCKPDIFEATYEKVEVSA